MLRLFYERFALALYACLAAALFLGVTMPLLTPQEALHFSGELEPIELSTVFFLLIGAGFAVYVQLKTRAKGWYLFAFLTTMAALRELDMNTMFTQMSMLKSRFYVTPTIPLHHKLISGFIILLVAYAAIRAAAYLWPTLKAALRGMKHNQAAYIGLGFMTMAKMIDSWERIFPFWKGIHQQYRLHVGYAEESMEMLAAFMLMLAPLYYLQWRKDETAKLV